MATTVLEQITKDVVPTATTNINQVLIEMLSGVKSAGGEIYGASKEAIHKSVDFVAEQAPDVINQFCTWRLVESSVMVLFYLFLVAIILFLSIFFYKRAHNYGIDQDCEEIKGMSYFILCIGIFVCLMILSNGVLHNIQTIAKIKVAPKVYIIEYVVDTIKNDGRNHR